MSNSEEAKSNGRGGARPGSGRKLKTVHLDDELAQSLDLILQIERRVRHTPTLDLYWLIKDMADDRWRKIEEGYGPTNTVAEEPLIF